ncbi:MAG: 2'-5' RNA ligase family protein [Phycicoccus sp.]
MTKTAASVRRPLLRGLVTALVAVTGTQDEVMDIIVPGAFTNTLAKRRPKLAYMHDWHKPLGRVLRIEELRPGDQRLPKDLPDGRAWPKEAGAVIAVMQFNLRTALGREMFEHCREWHIDGEAAFSIGYNVPDGMSTKRDDGVRLIYALDLYEVSLVLHGAHTMALALEVKDALGGEGKPTEVKDAPPGGVVDVPEDSVMVALYPAPDVAAELAVPGGCPADDLHITLALPGGADFDKVVAAVERAASGFGPLSGHVGGVGLFPPAVGSDSVPIWRAVDVPGLVEVRQAVVAALAAAETPHESEHGWTPHLTIGYSLPEAAPIENVRVQFPAVTVIRGDQYRVDVTLGAQPKAGMSGKAGMAVMEAHLVNALVSDNHPGAAVLEAKMLTAAADGDAELPSLGRASKTPVRKKRARTRQDQEVPA